MSKLSLGFLKSLFMTGRYDGPGRKGDSTNPRWRGHGKQVSGDSKYHRKMVRQGKK